MAIVKFGKLATVPSSGLTAGKIYFETSTGLIKVATSDTAVETFGGKIKDATYSDNILTITKTDGSNLTLNFSDIASASAVMEVFKEIKTDLDGKATKTVALKSVTGTASASASKVTITLTNTSESGAATSKPTIDLPVATDSAQGTTTWAKIKELAKAEAETVAGSVYKVKGTKATIDAVLAVGEAAIGDVYNVTAAFTLNSQKFPAGTNVVFVGPGEEGEPDPSAQAQWDALGGTVDLSPYATTSYVNTELGKKVSTSTQINGNALTGNVTLDGSDIALTGYTKASTESGILASDSINTAIGKLEKGIEAAKASGVTEFGGQTGAITVDTTASAAKSVKFTIGSDKKLTAVVNGVAVPSDITTAISNLDSNITATAASGDTVYAITGITEVDGKLTAKTEAAVDKAGVAATKANEALTSAKAYTDQALTWEEFE